MFILSISFNCFVKCNGQYNVDQCTSPLSCNNPDVGLQNMLKITEGIEEEFNLQDLVEKISWENDILSASSDHNISSSCKESFVQILEDLSSKEFYVIKGKLDNWPNYHRYASSLNFGNSMLSMHVSSVATTLFLITA